MTGKRVRATVGDITDDRFGSGKIKVENKIQLLVTDND